MSFLDGIKDMVGINPQMMGMVSGVQGLLEQNGGLSGLKAKFEQEGAGHLIQSWIGSGTNLPLTEEIVQKVFGQSTVQEFATKLGIDPATATQKLTELMPKLVDHLSPEGQLPESLNASNLMTAATKLFSKN